MSNNQTINYYRAFIKNSRKLKKKEKEILLMRFDNKTHKEIADQYGYKSKESIRAKEAKTLFKLFGFIVRDDYKIISRSGSK